jgi:hypothetical protein
MNDKGYDTRTNYHLQLNFCCNIESVRKPIELIKSQEFSLLLEVIAVDGILMPWKTQNPSEIKT